MSTSGLKSTLHPSGNTPPPERALILTQPRSNFGEFENGHKETFLTLCTEMSENATLNPQGAGRRFEDKRPPSHQPNESKTHSRRPTGKIGQVFT
jgi:hypothetical protein